MAFTSEISINQPRQRTLAFFRDPQTWLRLNPEWEMRGCAPVASSDSTADHHYLLDVCYDRSECSAQYRLRINTWPDDNGLTFCFSSEKPRTIHLHLLGSKDQLNGLRLEEECELPLETRQQTEVALWLKSTADYLAIASRPGMSWRFLRFLLDRVWLRLSPGGRRIAFLVLAFEMAGLLLLIAILLLQRWFS